MAYCRWSSDDWQCDVYCYHAVGDHWVIHVAGRRKRLRPGVSLPPRVPPGATPDWIARDQEVWRLIADDKEGVLWDWEPLEGPFAGLSFQVGSPAECANQLAEIRASGLNVPQHAIDALREEAA